VLVDNHVLEECPLAFLVGILKARLSLLGTLFGRKLQTRVLEDRRLRTVSEVRLEIAYLKSTFLFLLLFERVGRLGHKLFIALGCFLLEHGSHSLVHVF